MVIGLKIDNFALKCKFSMQVSENFRQAAFDYKFLLERKYPQKQILKLVSDKYRLAGNERTMLYRGIFTLRQAEHRKKKQIFSSDALAGQILYVDALNVLLTVTGYLKGTMMFVGNDHFLKDASEIHGKPVPYNLMQRAANLVLDYLNILAPASCYFILDRPVDSAEKLRPFLENRFNETSIQAEVKISDNPDMFLKNLDNGICCTSDSGIINRTKAAVFDLARHTLEYHFNPGYVNLQGF